MRSLFFSLWMYTMNRCLAALKTPLLLLALLVTGAVCLAPSAAQAQGVVRQFPAAALRGVMEVTQPPEILLNGQVQRLSPGARIKNTNNFNVLSGTLVGQQLLVNYTRDNLGLVHQVWILTPAEGRQPRAGVDTITNFRFESATN